MYLFVKIKRATLGGEFIPTAKYLKYGTLRNFHRMNPCFNSGYSCRIAVLNPGPPVFAGYYNDLFHLLRSAYINLYIVTID